MAHSISRLAKWLEWAATLAMALVLALVIYLMLTRAWLPGGAEAFFESRPYAVQTNQTLKFLAVAVSAIVPIVLIWTLNKMRQLFACYRQGQVLTERSAHLIGRVGFGFLLAAFAPILIYPLQGILLTWGAPVGQRVFVVELNQQTIFFALSGGFVTLIGWAMKEATRIAEEHKSFV